MSAKEKTQRYVEAMGYMTRAEGYITYEKPIKKGEVEVETVDAVDRVKDPNLPDHLGNNIDVTI